MTLRDIKLVEQLRRREHCFRNASEGEYDAYLLQSARLEIERLTNDLTAIKGKLRNVISHASGGHLSAEGDAERSCNDICVEISRHHNRIWEHAKEKPIADLTAMTAERDRMREALAPSAETKAAYIGEFSFNVELAHPRLGAEVRSIDVPWTTIKDIMGAIRERASLSGDTNG